MDTERFDDRASAIERARKSALCDAVLQITLYNESGRLFGPPPHALAIEIKEIFAAVDASALKQAESGARKLLSDAYRYGDIYIARKFAGTGQMLQQIRLEHPGYSEATYEEVLHHGCFLAR